jgi:ribonuclease R
MTDARGDSGREGVLQILREEGLDPAFPPEVEAEVAAMVPGAGVDDPSLVDLSAWAFVTIDGPASRDLDQALFLEQDGGDFVVHYAIADAAYFVRPGTALFREALRRGASYYVPGSVVPMLPRALSEGLVSLNPDGPRRAVVFTSRLAPDGRCVSTTITRARIQSQAKLSFPEVQRFFDGKGSGHLEGRPFTASLRLLPAVGQLRMRDQELRQVVRYRRVEVEIELDNGLDALMAVVASRGEVERYNEQLSLLCNSEGGRLLSGPDEGASTQGIYRAHPAPPASRLAELEELIEGLVAIHDLDESWRWRRGGERGLSEYLAALPEDGPHARVAAAIQRQAVMTNLRSSYTELPAAHHGVGARPYARFSAPMREIVGVFVHKELMEKLALQPSLPQAEDEALRQEVLTSAGRARDLQAQLDMRLNRLVIDRLLSRDLALLQADRPWRVATVMGITPNKIHLQLDEPLLDLKIYRVDLETTLGFALRPTPDLVALRDAADRPWLIVGSPIRLRVERFDEARDRWVLACAPLDTAAPPRPVGAPDSMSGM